MLDLTSEQGRIVSAAVGLAAERPWRDVTLAEIATRAGTSLVDVRKHFASKGEILVAFSRLVDDEVLRRAPRRDPGQSARDALFEVLMSRFDVLEPHKSAIRSIAGGGLPDPAQAMHVLASQRWMLEAAGIGTDGLEGSVKIAGLASVYASVFRTWLVDDDAGLARTMAALDRRLRRGERSMQSVDAAYKGMERIAGAICGAIRGRGTAKPAETAPSPATASPTAAPSP